MRADDFVTGDSARGAGQSSLVGTESTNAVNTGLVGSAAAIAKKWLSAALNSVMSIRCTRLANRL